MTTLSGTIGNDLLVGGAGNDSLQGLAGDDVLRGRAGNDWLEGGNGSDKLVGGPGEDHAYGGAGSDILRGGGGDDVLVGGDGDDSLFGQGGTDFLDGGEGNDSYVLTAQDSGAGDIFSDTGTGGHDVVDASRLSVLKLDKSFDDTSGIEEILGSETHSLVIDTSGTAVSWDFTSILLTHVDEIVGSSLDDVILGSESGDRIRGGNGDDFVEGHGGDDRLVGGAGEDWLDGGEGNDKLLGGTDRDRLFGGSGNDALRGGAGPDFLQGGAGEDNLRGGGGNDALVFDANDALLDGQAGDEDVLSLDATEGMTLDIRDMAGVTLRNIEYIQLGNNGDLNAHTLILDKASVKAMSDSTDELHVTGDESDAIVSEFAWTLVRETASYIVYESGNVTLYVQNGIDVSALSTEPLAPQTFPHEGAQLTADSLLEGDLYYRAPLLLTQESFDHWEDLFLHA